jgi:hypothetical protein
MKKYFTLRHSHVLLIFLVVAFLFALYAVILNRHYKKLKHQVSDDLSSVKVTKNRLIETSSLPLKLTYLANLKEKNIPPWGGALGLINGRFLLMDGHGQFYRIVEDKVESLILHVPNDFDLLIKEHPNSAFGLRATSFVYDDSTHKLYATFNKYIANDKVKLCVSSIDFNPSTFEVPPQASWETIFESQVFAGNAWKATESSGGKIFLSGEFLYLTIGYPIIDGFKTEQINVNAALRRQRGVVVKINKKTLKSSVIAQGLRNSQGLTIDSDGHLISTEHGPQGGDELNLIEEGADYGWPFETFGTVYNAYDKPLQYFKLKSSLAYFKEPIFSFVPSVGPSSIIQVKNFNQRWQGNLLVGSMKAETLYRLKYKNQKILYAEPIKLGHRIRDIQEDGNRLVLLTDDPYLIELKVDKKTLANNEKPID